MVSHNYGCTITTTSLLITETVEECSLMGGHPISVKVSDIKLCIMVRILISVTILASVSIFLLIPNSDCRQSSTRGRSTGQQNGTTAKIEDRAYSDSTSSAGRVRCGQPVSTFSARIVDGKIGSITQFPWMVSLQREKTYWFGYKYYKHTCGGSLISPSWIVTASHCFYNKEPPAAVVAGTDNLNFMYRAQMRGVSKVVLHPNFVPATFDNDIALIKVDRPFSFDSTFSHVRPICYEPGVPVVPYDIATVAGFGAKSYRQHTESRLYQTDIAIIDQNLCNKSFNNQITKNMICAGGMIPNKRDACSGDSGGPLQLEVDDHLSLIGVVSFGNDCATKGFPGIYTKLNNYYSWVLSHLDEPLPDP